MSNRSNKILGFGSPIVDFLLQVDEDFLKDNVGAKGGMNIWDTAKQEQVLKLATELNINITIAGGGSASNSIKGLGKLGDNVGFLGIYGNDKYAKIYLDELQNANVDTRYLFEKNSVITDRCLSFITPDCERTFRSCHSASGLIGDNELEKINFCDYKLIYIEGYQIYNLDFFLKIIESAKRCGVLVCLDFSTFQIAQSYRKLIRELLENHQIDIVFANLEEAKAYFNSDEMSAMEIIKEFQKLCKVSGLKLGANGAIVADKNKIVEAKSYPTKVVDTTGAGDFWASGFLHSYLATSNLEKSLEFANYISSKVIGHVGANLSEKIWQEVIDFYKTSIC